MSGQSKNKRKIKYILAAAIATMAMSGNVRGDIFEWYEPPTFGSSRIISTTLCPSGAGADAIPHANLSGMNLTKAYLIGYDLTEVSFSNSLLYAADFSRAHLSGSTFFGADLRFSTLPTDVAGADFTGADINGATVAFNADSTMGIDAQQLYSSGSYKHRMLRNLTVRGDATGWDFSNQDLTHTRFGVYSYTDIGGPFANVMGADFTNAVIAEVCFYGSKFSKAQLLSTASYSRHDLHGVNFESELLINDWSGVDFSNQNLASTTFSHSDLSNATFRGALLTKAVLSGNLTGVDLRLADLRGSRVSASTGTPNFTNAIREDSTISGLHLAAGDTLIVRDAPPHFVPNLIQIRNSMVIEPGSALQLRIKDANWSSRIDVGSGIPIQLGGTLDLRVDSDAIIHELIDTPVTAFSWNATLSPENRFEQIVVDDRFVWDTSNLYSTGVIEIVHLRGDANDDGQVDIRDLYTLASNWKLSDPLLGWDDADFDGNGSIDALDLCILAKNWQVGVDSMGLSSLTTLAATLGLPVSAVPEPASLGAVVLLGFGTLARRRRVTTAEA